MDFKNLCQKIDVEGIRAKMPAMPALTMPQMKMPKSMSKLKSRKIFRTSRENVSTGSGRNATQKRKQQQSGSLQQLPPPPAEFINRTPNRISTISSLMHQHQHEEHDDYSYDYAVTQSNTSTYRSAQRIDDDYPSPPRHYKRPISPIRAVIQTQSLPPDVLNGANNSQQAKLSLTEKLQKGYKDLSEFRLKHIFAKKTVLRKDAIEVQQYVAHYDEDRKREHLEQQQKDQQIADNYRFHFKVSRQNTGHSNSISSNESPASQQSARTSAQQRMQQLNEHSGDESGMEENLPQRRTGIAATRFANVRKPPLTQSASEESDEAEAAKTSGYKMRLRRLTDYISSSQEESQTTASKQNEAKQTTESHNMLSKLKNLSKRQQPNSNEQEKTTNLPASAAAQQESLGSTIKNNFKRMQKSLKRQQSSVNVSSDEEEQHAAATNKTTTTRSRAEKFSERLRRFKSRESLSNVETGNESPKQKSPVHVVIANKIQNWKKSFKRKPAAETAETAQQHSADEETSPEKQTNTNKRSGTLIKKLRKIRARKQPASTEELDAATDDEVNNEQQKSKSSNLEQRFEQARQRTIKKVNEKFQQIKLFQKNTDNNNDQQEQSEQNQQQNDANAAPAIKRRHKNATPVARRDSVQAEELEIDEIETISTAANAANNPPLHAAWSSKPIHADSVDDSDAAESTTDEYPRVLIHQDNTDVFESTLIIAVTSPVPSASPIARQLTDMAQTHVLKASSPKTAQWLPNEQIIAGFLESTPPTARRHDDNYLSVSKPQRAHARRLSIDSRNADADAWLPDNEQRRASSVAVDKDEAPWQVHSVFPEDKLYKTKSINIFEKNAYENGGEAAFDDFDDELKNAPIVKIKSSVAARNVDSLEEYSSSEDADAADDDNSSRVTKILKQNKNTEIEMAAEISKAVSVAAVELHNSRESLIAHYDENEETQQDSDDEADSDDRPPSAAPSPPPSPPPNMSPPPPPLPQRRSPLPTAAHSQPITAGLPLLINKAPKIPERNESMSRIAKPLVKTSSLRLSYSEQMKPADVGKVNKLISRFDAKPRTGAGMKLMQRPHIVPRMPIRQDESEDYSEEDEQNEYDDTTDEDKFSKKLNDQARAERDGTLTPTNNKGNTNETPKINATNKRAAPTAPVIKTIEKHNLILPTLIIPDDNGATARPTQDEENNLLLNTITSKVERKCSAVSINKLSLDKNANCSRPSSEYGSPLEYPSSLRGSTESTPMPERRLQPRSRRSLARDEEHFHSFDSDEENSYYSISSTNSNRHVVEI